MINDIKQEILEDIEIYKLNSIDHYDFWNEHIKYVYDEGIKLAEIYKADKTIVKLGALLHDIALIKNIGEKKEHHINGTKIAKEILERHNCPKEIEDKVIKCILNHRSSKKATTLEELCVSDADILAHFDNIPMLFNLAYKKNNLELHEVRKYIKEIFEKDYNDLSDKTKETFKDKYKLIYETILK